MNKESFTEDQIETLRKNPYTRTVTRAQIRFTDAFKDFFWKRLMDGISPVDIFTEAGYDPDLIGRKRIANVRQLVAASHKELTAEGNSPEKKKLKEMENRIKVMEAQIEALKKIIILSNAKKKK